jgi:hypothetical protein
MKSKKGSRLQKPPKHGEEPIKQQIRGEEGKYILVRDEKRDTK